LLESGFITAFSTPLDGRRPATAGDGEEEEGKGNEKEIVR
jgi:hypothetical protein